MRRIAIGGLAGWAGIVALAWHLADKRIELCGYAEHACDVRATATRDNVLIWGLAVFLCAGLMGAVLEKYFRRRPNGLGRFGARREIARQEKSAGRSRIAGIALALILVAIAASIVAPKVWAGWERERAEQAYSESVMADVEANMDAERRNADADWPGTLVTPVEGDPYADIAAPVPEAQEDVAKHKASGN